MIDANGSPFVDFLNGRTELTEHENVYVRNNAISLVAAEIRLRIENLNELIVDGLTDGPDDKKCDLVFYDNDFRRLYLVQGYASPTTGDKEAGANKATDMNSAISWLLQGDLMLGNEKIRKVAEEARKKISAGVIEEIELWYVHNKLESGNVKNELNNAASTAKHILKNQHPNNQINVRGVEVGIESLNRDYTRADSPIVVTDDLSFHTENGFEVRSEKWETFFSAVDVVDLKKYWIKYTTNLLTPNVRDFLGVRNSKKNINKGIADTLIYDSENFLVFNNGITVLVNDYEWNPSSSVIKVRGMGIVNGGQTTGTIGKTLAEIDSDDNPGKVLARFIKCTDKDVLRNIVQYNNLQNSVHPSDFRSTDIKQKNLVQEFQRQYGNKVLYNGARRGEVLRLPPEDKKKTLTDKIVAQSLVAFSGDSDLAYNRYSEIWDIDSHYNMAFENVSAEHILFTSTLLKSIEKYKIKLSVEKEKLTEEDKNAYLYLINRGAHIVLVQAISASIESLLGNKTVSDKKKLHFKLSEFKTIDDCEKVWTPVIEMFTPIFELLLIDGNLQISNKKSLDMGIQSFTKMVSMNMRNASQPAEILNFRNAVQFN